MRTTPPGKARARKATPKQIYKLVYDGKEVTKPQLTDALGMSPTAVSSAINELAAEGLIVTNRKADSIGGRPAMVYEIDPTFRYIVGVDIRRNYFYVFVSDLYANIHANTISKAPSTDPRTYLASVCDAIYGLLSSSSIGISDVLAIGIAVSGVTDFDNSIVDRSNEMDWTDVPVAKIVYRALKIRAFIETDVRVYARNMIDPSDPQNVSAALFVGTGIGLALVSENRIFRGYTNRAGDNRFFGPDIKRLAEIVRSDELIKEINSLPYYAENIQHNTIEDLNDKFAIHLAGHDGRRELFEEFTTEIARLMIAMACLVNPKSILLTGNVFDYNDIIFENVRSKINACEYQYFTPDVYSSRRIPHALERGIVSTVMEKFFELDDFKI